MLRLIIACGLVSHFALNILFLARVEVHSPLTGLLCAAGIVAGIYLTDFSTSFIHWLGDADISWKNPYLRRFHELSAAHHKNPNDILDKSYFEIKGNIAFFYMPPLLLALCLTRWEALLPVAFMLMTLGNLMLAAHTIHKWCHERSPGRLAAGLQALRIIIKPGYHLKHHKPPYMSNFSGINGWAEPLFDAVVLRRFSRRTK